MALKEHIKVMVVDDMSVSRGLLEQALDKIGVKNVAYKNDGQSALDDLSAKPVHLVISDFNMPKMDGLQLLESLRKQQKTQKIGFVLVTGSEDGNVVTRGKELGMNNFIKKPFTPDSLRSCLEEVVGPLG